MLANMVPQYKVLLFELITAVFQANVEAQIACQFSVCLLMLLRVGELAQTFSAE